jgi:hypothetical protein
MTPCVDTSDDVRRFIVGERLRLNEPERLHGEDSQQHERNCRAGMEITAATKD